MATMNVTTALVASNQQKYNPQQTSSCMIHKLQNSSFYFKFSLVTQQQPGTQIFNIHLARPSSISRSFLQRLKASTAAEV